MDYLVPLLARVLASCGPIGLAVYVFRRRQYLRVAAASVSAIAMIVFLDQAEYGNAINNVAAASVSAVGWVLFYSVREHLGSREPQRS